MADYKFSVIIPVYNVENYIAESIESIVQQSIGFENIQVIIVDDGSTDGSGEICKEYADKYENIEYILKENGGVSSARNLGIEHIEGKYVNFLDSDDMWTSDSFLLAYNFFENHKDEVDVVAARIQFFEANDNFHALDYKFDPGTRVADLNTEEELFSIQSTTATTFIRAEAIGDLRFDVNLQLGEDSTFINKLMLKKCKYGLLREAIYLYRRRAVANSAVNKQTVNKSFYTDSLVNYHMELFRYSEQLYGEIIPYIQSMIGYDICWRFGNPKMKETLDEEEQKVYIERVHEILSKIDDRILMRHPIHRSMQKRADILYYKYGIDLFENIDYHHDDGKLYYKEYPILNLRRNKTNVCLVVTSEIRGDKFVVEMLVAKWLLHTCERANGKLMFKLGDEIKEPIRSKYTARQTKTRDGMKDYCDLMSCEFDFKNQLKTPGEKLVFQPIMSFGDKETTVSISYNKFIPTSNNFRPIYKFYGDYAIKNFRTNITIYYPKNKKLSKRKWDKECIKFLKEIERYDLVEIRYKKLPKYRKQLAKLGKIWLISDRIDNAGDNGEVLFKYICEHKPEGVCPVFVIGEMAKDEVKERLNKIGKVIYAEDEDYPYYFLCAEKIISSSAGEFTINPFDADRKYLIDLFNYKYYFMNHGVNCGDCSAWLNKYNKQIDVLFSTGESERQNIIDRDYNYSPEQIVITGLARFDALYDNPTKQLLVLPTWRRAYRECYDDKTSSIYCDTFKETDFFKFYNGLITDERLLKVMREKGYTGLFCLHPIFAKQSSHFENSDVFKINEGFVDYNKAFAESSVMVTDYSTIAFDFAYLSKPIVYTQFDQKEFYENQIYDECFDYKNEGFGPVCTDLDSAVNALIEVIENDCENKYIDRVEHFFVNHDKNNSKRILEAVLADDEKNK